MHPGSSAIDPGERARTLGWCGVLHVFTHLYNVALLPLYLAIQRDLGLNSVEQATGLVTALMLGYVLPGFAIGVVADRWSRHRLLGLGLAVNALAFMGLSVAQSYPAALVCAVIAGIGGSCYHPAANALIAQADPLNPGRTFGLVGIGASVGFCFGPLYAGWRAEHASWREPVFELGLAGLVTALAFLAAHRSTPPPPRRSHAQPVRMFPQPMALVWFLAACLGFSLRDFSASAMASLTSLFLQQVHHFSVERTGFALSLIFLASAVSNPLIGHLSDRGQGRWITGVMFGAAALMTLFPRVAPGFAELALAGYGFFMLASYPITEAALVLAVPDEVRGRIFGLFLTVAGFIGNLGHWRAGVWVNDLGATAANAPAYFPLYAWLGMLVVLAPLAMPCLNRLKHHHRQAALPSNRPTPSL
ncbi:MAG: MFS transporter [Limisphaerales bacterium]